MGIYTFYRVNRLLFVVGASHSRSASSDEVLGLGGSSGLSSSSEASAITSRLDTQHSLRLLHILPIFEGDLDLAAGDLAVEELALLLPLVDQGNVLAFVVMVGRDVSRLVAFLAGH